MALTIYGSARSRTMRTLWLAEELRLNYEHIPVAWDDPRLKAPEFLALNPAGAIPTIVDDGVVVSESMAIALYLARRHDQGGLYPTAPQSEASAIKWSFWAQGELEPFVQRDARTAELKRSAASHFGAAIARTMSILERGLTDRSWLVEDRFTVADLNVASVLSPSRSAEIDMSGWGAVSAWLDRCRSRPAAVAVRRRFG